MATDWFVNLIYFMGGKLSALDPFAKCRSRLYPSELDEATMKQDPTHMVAIGRLDVAISTINGRIGLLEEKSRNLVEIARKNAHNNKTAAMTALKTKAMHTKQISSLLVHRDNLELTKSNISDASFNNTLAQTMKEAAASMREIQKDTTPGDIDDDMLGIDEASGDIMRISDALSKPLNTQQYIIDDEELEAELADLLSDQVTISVTHDQLAYYMPPVPSSTSAASSSSSYTPATYSAFAYPPHTAAQQSPYYRPRPQPTQEELDLHRLTVDMDPAHAT